MFLYHGSNVKVEDPHLINQLRGLDFGAGFYLTSDKYQAERFSQNVVRRTGCGTPLVSIYEFDLISAEKHIDILRFQSADYSWLEYVKDNRLKSYIGKEYDLVIGAVAGDDVLPVILLYLNGQLDADLTIGALKTRNLVDQFCFKSQKALALLKYQHSEVINDK